ESDLYALGATAFHAMTGKAPYDGSEEALLHSVLLGARLEVPDLPMPIGRVLTKLCAKEVGERHRSAAQLLADLERLGDFDLPVPEPPRGEAGAGVLIGRDAELAQLSEWLTQLALGKQRKPIFAICGARGQGRSRLAGEALRQLRLQAAAGHL